MKILGKYWFCKGGIVRVQTDYEGIKYFILGMKLEPYGNPDDDAIYIAEMGNTFPKDAGDALFGVKE